MKKNIFPLTIGVLTLSLCIGYVALAAWSNPTQPPTGGNVDIPVNVGGDIQLKMGAFGVGGALTVGGDVQIKGNILEMAVSEGNREGQLFSIGHSSQRSKILGGILDVRRPANFPDTTTDINYNPPTTEFSSRSVTAHFSTSWPGSSWGSGINVKGWTDNYNTWTLMGAANTSSGSQNLYFRNGRSGTWQPWRKVIIESNSGDVSVSGVVSATGYLYSSDMKYKTDVEKIENSLEKLNTLNGISYKLKDNDYRTMGLSAQEVQQAFPDAVRASEDGDLSIDPAALIAVLVESIKEQQKEINQLNEKINK